MRSTIEDADDAIHLIELRLLEVICIGHDLSLLLLQPLPNVFKSIGHLLLDSVRLISEVTLSRFDPLFDDM